MPQATDVISVLCTCGKKLKAPASAVGRKAKCPKCGTVLTVQAPPPPPKHDEDDPFGAMYDLAEQSEQAAANQQLAPRCPGCMGEMAAGAVLCTNCGYDTRTGQSVAATPVAQAVAAPTAKGTRYDPAAAAAAAAANAKNAKKKKGVDKMAPQASYWRGLAGCIGAAAAGGFLWFLVAWGTGYELYFLVLIVAAAAGVGMQWGQKGYSYAGGFTAAGVTLVTMILARLAVVVALVVPMIRATAASSAAEEAAMRMPDLSKYDQRVVDHLYQEEFEKLPEPKGGGSDDEAEEDEDAEPDLGKIGSAAKEEMKREAAAYQAVEKKLAAMPKAQYDALAEKLRREERDGRLEGLLVDEVIKTQYNVHPDNATAGIYQDASKTADARLAAMDEPKRESEYKRLAAEEVKEEERARAAAKAERDARKSRGEDVDADARAAAGAAAAIGGVVIFFLMFGGIKGVIWTLIALGLAFRTASGSVSD